MECYYKYTWLVSTYRINTNFKGDDFLYIDEVKINVRYAETDKMGVVYHSNYLIYFEVGRTNFINKCGISYSQMEEKGIMIPLLESNCKYLQGAKYEDDLIVKTWIEELSGAKVKFNYIHTIYFSYNYYFVSICIA